MLILIAVFFGMILLVLLIYAINSLVKIKSSRLKIPSAYIRLDQWKKIHPDKSPVSDSIRYLNEEIPYVFESNEEYSQLLSRCRADTKELQEALHKLLKSSPHNPPLWFKNSRCSKQYRKVLFIISPPLLTSTKKGDNLFLEPGQSRQPRSKSTDIVNLHFDENKILQGPRCCFIAGDDSYIRAINTFRQNVLQGLFKASVRLEGSYGDWDAMAGIILNLVNSHYSIIEPYYTKEESSRAA